MAPHKKLKTFFNKSNKLLWSLTFLYIRQNYNFNEINHSFGYHSFTGLARLPNLNSLTK